MGSKQLPAKGGGGERTITGGGTGKRTNICGGGEMASKGLAVTMVLLSLVTVGTNLPEY